MHSFAKSELRNVSFFFWGCVRKLSIHSNSLTGDTRMKPIMSAYPHFRQLILRSLVENANFSGNVAAAAASSFFFRGGIFP